MNNSLCYYFPHPCSLRISASLRQIAICCQPLRPIAIAATLGAALTNTPESHPLQSNSCLHYYLHTNISFEFARNLPHNYM